MSLKRWKQLSVIAIFIIASLLHFTYELLPNNFIASFTPVNESVWEHLKMTFNAFLIYSVIDYIILKKYKKQVNNFLFSVLTSTLTSLLVILILFYPIYYSLGNNIIITQIIFLVSIIAAQYISYLVLAKTFEEKTLNILSIIVLLFFEFFFIYLTFNPREDDIFIDSVNNKLGLNNYFTEQQ